MKHTEETKRKISKSKKGQGKGVPKGPMSNETKQKLSESRRKNSVKYSFMHPEHGKFVGSTGDLGRSYDIRTSEVYKLVKGYYKTYKGWQLI